MIKKYVGESGEMLFIANKSDIKAIYKSIARNINALVVPWNCDFPIFSERKQTYALEIDHHYMYVVNIDTAVAGILDGTWREKE